jgi:hypothetical protein
MLSASAVRDNDLIIQATRDRIEEGLDTAGFVTIETDVPGIVEEALRQLGDARCEYSTLQDCYSGPQPDGTSRIFSFSLDR